MGASFSLKKTSFKKIFSPTKEIPFALSVMLGFKFAIFRFASFKSFKSKHNKDELFARKSLAFVEKF